jgi:hypothetical protein
MDQDASTEVTRQLRKATAYLPGTIRNLSETAGREEEACSLEKQRMRGSPRNAV